MKKLRGVFIFSAFALIALCVFASGCGRAIGGPRFWYDDRNQSRLEDYSLPDDPGAPAEYGTDRVANPSGSDISEDDLDNYRTDLDREEEERKAGASLVDF